MPRRLRSRGRLTVVLKFHAPRSISSDPDELLPLPFARVVLYRSISILYRVVNRATEPSVVWARLRIGAEYPHRSARRARDASTRRVKPSLIFPMTMKLRDARLIRATRPAIAAFETMPFSAGQIIAVDRGSDFRYKRTAGLGSYASTAPPLANRTSDSFVTIYIDFRTSFPSIPILTTEDGRGCNLAISVRRAAAAPNTRVERVPVPTDIFHTTATRYA